MSKVWPLSRFVWSARSIRPGGVTFAGGEITVQHVSLTHPSLPERLTELQGRFVLSEGGTMFDQVTGHFGDLTLQISGGITGGSSSAFQDFLIRIKGDADHMVRLLPSQAIPAGTFEGLVNGAVVLTGPTLSPHLRGEVVLTESKVTLPGLVEKPIGAQATVEFEGMIPQGSGVLLDKVELIVPPIRLPVKGKIQFGERFSIDAALSTGTLSLSRVPEWIAKGGFEAGNIELSLDMKGKGLDWKAWRTTGWLALTNGLMNAKGADGPIQDLYLRVQFVKNDAEIKRLSFRLLDSDVALEGTIRNWAAKPHDYRQDRVQSNGSRSPHPERPAVADPRFSGNPRRHQQGSGNRVDGARPLQASQIWESLRPDHDSRRRARSGSCVRPIGQWRGRRPYRGAIAAQAAGRR